MLPVCAYCGDLGALPADPPGVMVTRVCHGNVAEEVLAGILCSLLLVLCSGLEGSKEAAAGNARPDTNHSMVNRL